MSASKKVAQLRLRIQEIHQSYIGGYAGQPRISRDPSNLRAWVELLRGIQRKAKTLPPKFKQEIKTLSDERIKLYSTEAEVIEELQSCSDTDFSAYSLGEWMNLSHDRYQRHFAGFSRNTRDVSLLMELSVELNFWKTQAMELFSHDDLSDAAKEFLQSSVDRANGSIDLYAQEKEAINESQSQGELNEQAGLLAFLANQLFETYRQQFQGYARGSRRLSTLQRVNESLEFVFAKMHSLQSDGCTDQHLTQNIQIVENNLQMYQSEARQIEQVQEQMSYEQWIEQLSKSVDEVRQEYKQHFADQPRANCDPNLLRSLCDRLYDASYQLRGLVEEDGEDIPAFAQSLDMLRLYHREYVQVLAAQPKQERIVH